MLTIYVLIQQHKVFSYLYLLLFFAKESENCRRDFYNVIFLNMTLQHQQ